MIWKIPQPETPISMMFWIDIEYDMKNSSNLRHLCLWVISNPISTKDTHIYQCLGLIEGMIWKKKSTWDSPIYGVLDWYRVWYEKFLKPQTPISSGVVGWYRVWYEKFLKPQTPISMGVVGWYKVWQWQWIYSN